MLMSPLFYGISELSPICMAKLESKVPSQNMDLTRSWSVFLLKALYFMARHVMLATISNKLHSPVFQHTASTFMLQACLKPATDC